MIFECDTMPKDISDIRKAFGVTSKVQPKEEDAEEETEELVETKQNTATVETKSAQSKSNVLPAPLIPLSDPFYNFIMGSPTVTPAMIRRYDVKGKQILVLVDSLDRSLLNCTITLPEEKQ